jgi:hypothetical protein
MPESCRSLVRRSSHGVSVLKMVATFELLVGDDVGATQRGDVHYAGDRVKNGLYLIEHALGALNRCSIGEPDRCQEDALIFVRQESGGQTAKESAGREEEYGERQHRNQRPADQAGDAGDIAIDRPIVQSIEASEKRRQNSALFAFRPQHQSAKRGA